MSTPREQEAEKIDKDLEVADRGALLVPPGPHGRSLLGLRDLIDRSLAHVRLDAGIGGLELISGAELVDAHASASPWDTATIGARVPGVSGASRRLRP